MKKLYQKPLAEIVVIYHQTPLLDESQTPYIDAKETQMRFEEEQEMHEELGRIFSSDNLVNPWE